MTLTSFDCRAARRALARARDGALSPGERELLGHHAADCARCADLRAAETRLAEAVAAARRTHATLAPPPGFARRVVLAAADARAGTARNTGGASRLAWGLPLAAAAAFAFATLVLIDRDAQPTPAGDPPGAHGISAAAGAAPAAQAAANTEDDADALGPLLWSDGTIDVVAPSWEPWADRQQPTMAAVLVEYDF